jgi:hypothetical protein
VAVVAVSLVLLIGNDERQPRARSGTAAPTLVGKAVRDGQVSLERLHGHIVLLSFLNTRADATPEGDSSRAQAVFLRSMQSQHGRFGLRVIIVDASEIAGAGKPSRNELINYTYDAHLGPAITVLADDGTRARRFVVRRAPTTFLIDLDGAIQKRWDGFAGAAQIDLAIRRLEGRSPTD